MLVAVALVTVLVAGLGVAGLLLYSREINTTIANAQNSAVDFARGAEARHVPFAAAAIEFEQNVRREGLRSIAFPPRPRGAGPPAFLPPGFGPPPDQTIYIDGIVRHAVGPRSDNGLGITIARIAGVRRTDPTPFLGGRINFFPDSALFGNIALTLLLAVLGAALAAGLLAAAVGRFITSQAIRPLIDVTEALQRFAARDFRAQPIAVEGRSDFDVLAQAYNAASTQVAAAFAERDAAEAQMRQFVADAGHELRTPLTIILGYTDLLRRRVNGDDRTQFIFSSVAAEGRRMRTLVDNLVLLAKLEGDDVRPAEPFDLGELVAEIVEVRRGLHPAVRFEFDVAVSATVIGDRTEVHEALANIVDNAINYAPASPIYISVAAAGDGAVEIVVADEGPGIAPQDRDSIFERFFRGVSRGEVEGSGLGLAIAKRAVERAGGTLRLDTGVARGTRFIIRLRADRLTPREAQRVV